MGNATKASKARRYAPTRVSDFWKHKKQGLGSGFCYQSEKMQSWLLTKLYAKQIN